MSSILRRDSQDAAQLFARDGYVSLRAEIAPEICELAVSYALLKERVEFGPEGADGQVPGAHAGYGDALMETLLETTRPRIEQATGLRLFPTYSYYRVYRPGAELEPHRDRESCEISASICLGYRYRHEDPSFRWPLCMDALRGPGSGTALSQEAGDVIVYRGREVRHWRERFAAQAGSYLVQAFLHYVDQDGPCRDYRYDRREGLGQRSTASEERIRALIDQAFPEFARGRGRKG